MFITLSLRSAIGRRKAVIQKISSTASIKECEKVDAFWTFQRLWAWLEKDTTLYPAEKGFVQSKPLVQKHSFNKQVTLKTRASEKAIGGVSRENEYLFSGISRDTTTAKQKYGNTE